MFVESAKQKRQAAGARTSITKRIGKLGRGPASPRAPTAIPFRAPKEREKQIAYAKRQQWEGTITAGQIGVKPIDRAGRIW